VSEDSAFYDRALRRIDRATYVLAPVLVAGVLAVRGWRDALGCAAGALLSFVNLRLWKRAAAAITNAGKPAQGGSAAFFGLRYLLLGGAVFVIIKYFGVSVLAVLAGLFISVAAIVLEILYQLIFTSHKA
jgi:hypothetical protein